MRYWLGSATSTIRNETPFSRHEDSRKPVVICVLVAFRIEPWLESEYVFRQSQFEKSAGNFASLQSCLCRPIMHQLAVLQRLCDTGVRSVATSNRTDIERLRAGATKRLSNYPSEIHPDKPGWRNWQTQRTQNPPVLSTLGVRFPLPAPALPASFQSSALGEEVRSSERFPFGKLATVVKL